MVPRCKRAEPALLRPISKQPVALAAGAFLDRRGGLLAPTYGEDAVWYAKPLAHAGDHVGFLAALRAQTVIDSRGFDLTRPRRRGKQQERETVRSAGDSNSKARSGRDQIVEIVTKAIEKAWLH